MTNLGKMDWLVEGVIGQARVRLDTFLCQHLLASIFGQAKWMGAKARSLLAGPGFSGKVLAVLSTTIYLLGDDGEILWVALEELPLHRRCLLASFQPAPSKGGADFFHSKWLFTNWAGRSH